MMKWNKTHRKGTKQTCISYTTEAPTFTPSIAFLDKYFAYVKKCEDAGITPKECEDYYHNRN